MSKVNLHCQEIYWGEIIPGVHLAQAKQVDLNFPYIGDNNVPMLEGCFGLVFENDPFVVFSQQPIEYKGLEYYYKEGLHEQREVIWKFDSELTGQIQDMYKLMKCLIKAGYNKEEYIRPGFFICDKIAKFIKENKPIEIYEKV